MDYPVRKVWEAEFRERFRCLFELKPDITPKEIYNILESTDFDEKKTIYKVWELAEKPQFYCVSADIMDGAPVQLLATSHHSPEVPRTLMKAPVLDSPSSPAPSTPETVALLLQDSPPFNSSNVPAKKYPVDSQSSPIPSQCSNRFPFTQEHEPSDISSVIMTKRAVDSPNSPVVSKADTSINADSRLKPKALSDEDDMLGFHTQSTSQKPNELTRTVQDVLDTVERWQSHIDDAVPVHIPQLSQHESGYSVNDLEELPAVFDIRSAQNIPNRKPNPANLPLKRKRKLAEARELEPLESEFEFSTDDSDGLPDISDMRGRNKPDSSGIEDLGSNQKPVSKMPNKPAKNSGLEGHTAVTKWIGKLAGGLFVRNLLVCGITKEESSSGLEEAARGEDTTIQALINMTVNPEEIQGAGWRGRRVTEKITLVKQLWDDTKKSGKKGYTSARVDDVHLEPGDFVTVRPGEDEKPLTGKNRKEVDSTDISTLESIWFARITYLFQAKDDTLMAHLRWMAHGGETILGETAGPRELFLLSRCDDVPLGAIAGKIKVDYRGRYGGSSGVGTIEESYHEVNHYFYRQHYSEVSEKFDEARLHQSLPDLQSARGNLYCDCCQSRKREEKEASTSSIGETRADGTLSGILHRGVSYRLRDFVYLTPKTEKLGDEPYKIGQITCIQPYGLRQFFSRNTCKLSAQVSVQIFERFDTLLEPYLEEVENEHVHTRDNRRLYWTSKFVDVQQDRLQGKCIVQHADLIDDLNAFKDEEDTFYVTHQVKGSIDRPQSLADLETLDSRSFRYVLDDDDDLATYVSQRSAFLTVGRKLRGLDVFAGAGLLSAGLDLSGACTTEWAVECDPSAAATFKRNNPGASVYCHDANVVLRQAVEENLGTNASALRDELGNQLPKLPKPGDVDVICGGPPCQDFTRCNQYQKAKSPKNSLLATHLSYVDHFRPKYFLLENVQDLVDHRLGSSQVNIHRTEGGIEMGAAKFILRALTSLGYQCQYGVLQAGEYGTPQSRRRVFFWGSLPGYCLPKFPEPSHIFTGVGFRKSKYSRSTRVSAPHRAVTVGDAIMDLPAFDWMMSIREETSASKAARKKRAETIKQVSLSDNATDRVGQDFQNYATEPLSEYQRVVRCQTTGRMVQNHYTCRWGDEMMERVLRIPMQPGANHNDIPMKWDMACLRKTQAATRHQFYPDRLRRLNFESRFQTCLTKIDPSGKNGNVLHPSQHRVLTVREQARAMGLPDSFTWDHETQTPKDMYRQIGNGVAIPQGRALGRELLKVLVSQWAVEQASQSPDDVLQSIEYHEDDVERENSVADDIPGTKVAANVGVFEIEDEYGQKWMQID